MLPPDPAVTLPRPLDPVDQVTSVARLVVDLLLDHLQPDRVGVAVLDPATGALRPILVRDRHGSLPVDRFPLAWHRPEVIAAVRRGEELFHSGQPPATHPLRSADDVAAGAHLSLLGPEGPVGLLSLAWATPRTLPQGERRLLRGVAEITAHGTDRARLSADLSAQMQRITVLQQATADLAAAATTEDVITAIALPARDVLGACSVGIGLIDAERRTLTFHDIAQAPLTLGSNVYDLESVRHSLSGQAIRTGRPAFAADPDELRRNHPIRVVTDFLLTTEERAWVCVPLAGSREVRGVLRVAWPHPRTPTESSLAFLSTLAGQGAQALERIELRRAEHAAVELLTTGLLPDRIPQRPGLRVEARLVPSPRGNAPAGSRLGGDWWDVVPLAGGRLGLVVGDVMGKGLGAVAAAGRVRNALRLALTTQPGPGAALDAVDELLRLTEPDDQIVTVCAAVVDPGDGAVSLASAGHPPPVLVTGDGAELVALDPGPPLGVAGVRPQTALQLAPGQLLVLFTDGLVESRRRGLGPGLDALVDHAARDAAGFADDPGGWLDRLLAAMLPAGCQDDDVTLLAAGPVTER